MKRRFVVSDIHGYFEAYQKIAEFLDEDDIVFCLGDCADRGPDGWKTLKAIVKDPRFFLLKGNHEDMLVAAMAEVLQKEVHTCMKYGNHSVELLDYNGGFSTLDDWMKEDGDKREIWMYYLAQLPLYHEVETSCGDRILLTHAGFTPPNLPSEEDLVWGRGHFEDKWPDELDRTFIIHGHSPCPLLNPNWAIEDGAMYYAHGHKINIDMGTHATKHVLLFDLDTFDEHIFELGG